MGPVVILFSSNDLIASVAILASAYALTLMGPVVILFRPTIYSICGNFGFGLCTGGSCDGSDTCSCTCGSCNNSGFGSDLASVETLASVYALVGPVDVLIPAHALVCLVIILGSAYALVSPVTILAPTHDLEFLWTILVLGPDIDGSCGDFGFGQRSNASVAILASAYALVGPVMVLIPAHALVGLV
ncbi:hypothetical protein BASA81_004330 [Batrachochytrium salamandrivorans]|nr:hypothetical protein BASA81_004330 [Batrachochytrium salamandrivorans]